MTPAARYAAAIEVLDNIQSGAPAEKALLAWARARRFAGSKDRAAVRDHVFDILRRKRTCERRGNGTTGRALVLGLLRDNNVDPSSVFTGEGYAPDVLSERETAYPIDLVLSDAEQANLPDETWALWQSSLAENALPAAKIASSRGPISIRVNENRLAKAELVKGLLADEIETREHPTCDTALIITKNERRLAANQYYLEGCFELQDASSQRAMSSLQLPSGTRVLDFCAGGGGKSLALGAMFDVKLTAFDSSSSRMKDLSVRAKRAGIYVEICESLGDLDPSGYDLVLVDAPCSGSGTWRRTPDQKWKIDAQDVEEFSKLQLSVLSNAHEFVCAGGELAYATCSVFTQENETVVHSFLGSQESFALKSLQRFDLTNDQDGFFMARIDKT